MALTVSLLISKHVEHGGNGSLNLTHTYLSGNATLLGMAA